MATWYKQKRGIGCYIQYSLNDYEAEGPIKCITQDDTQGGTQKDNFING